MVPEKEDPSILIGKGPPPTGWGATLLLVSLVGTLWVLQADRYVPGKDPKPCAPHGEFSNKGSHFIEYSQIIPPRLLGCPQ